MFVFEKNGAICVSFGQNKPTDTPDYVIVFDEANKTITVNGKSFSEADKTADVVETPVIETPTVKTTRKTKQVTETVAEDTATEVTAE